MLSAIRADLDRSPWIGEGHRKIWARLRVLDGIRVARKRVLRLMRENGLLSPHRHLARQGEAHDGRIITTAPNLMWGTDATQIPTVLDGKVWLLPSSTTGTRKLSGGTLPRLVIATPLPRLSAWRSKREFGAVAAADRTRSCPPSRPWQRVHGRPLPEPDQVLGHGSELHLGRADYETNGVAERFFRTFKEQVIHGRIYQTIDDVRAAARKFSNSTTPSGSSRKTGYAARVKRVSPGSKPP